MNTSHIPAKRASSRLARASLPKKPVAPGVAPTPQLPHERDQAPGPLGTEPRKVIEQARKDLEAGLVDTDMRATPGLDAARRQQLVSQPPK